MSLKDHNDIIQTIEHFNATMQQATWDSTPFSNKEHHISTSIKEKLKEKCNLRKHGSKEQWQHYRSPIIKTGLNKAIKDP